MLFLLASFGPFAQVPTSSLTGLIKDDKGEASIGATGDVHQPMQAGHAHD
jgi:hypothetical protein